MDITAQASSIGSLADETRRALYEYVAGQTEPVSRDAAAEAIGIPAHMARFHLDKLVEAGLLDTEFRRLSGRTGPGAGRPSKLYLRTSGTISVSLPERRYDLVGHLLAGAIEKNADKQGWARVSAVANHMRQHDGQTAKAHGKASWTKVLKSLPGYEFRNEGTTSVSVRIRPVA